MKATGAVINVGVVLATREHSRMMKKSGHIRKITIIVSLLLHLIFLASYDSLRHIFVFSPDASLADPEQEKQIVFEFEQPMEVIESPDDAIQQVPTDKTNLLSDRNSIARDRYTQADKPVGAPYQQGDLDINSYYETRGMETEPVAPSTESPNPESDRQQESKAKSQSEYSLNTAGSEEFSRQALMGKQPQQQGQNQILRDSDDFSAREVGGLAFNTYNWEYAPYLLYLKDKIQQNIYPPPAFNRMAMVDGDVLVRFRIMPNGELAELKVLEYKGQKALMETSVKAVENSAVFKPLPADFPESYLEVTGRFLYPVLRK